MSKFVWVDFKESLEEKMPCLLLSGLIFELIILIIMIVFEFNKESSTDLFYLFSIIILMLSTIYFAWHSIVKENAFELIAFIVMSSILNFHGIYQAITDLEITFLHWLSIATFSFVQLFYYFAFYFVYNRFGWRAVNEMNTTNLKLIKAYKLYETFMSTLKLDFLLYFMTIAMFIYYVLIDWSSFNIIGVSIGVGIFISLVNMSIIGYCSVKGEKGILMIIYLIILPFGEVLKIFMLIQVALSPGRDIDDFIFIEAVVIAVIDFIICFIMMVIGILLKIHFNIGLKHMMRKNIDSLQKPIISK
ncbi:hypothetical protein SteCoe_9680 [Stentor coeruleus]|uniref:Uncharacterized protein n=1 Tax=Stentor coeruleus TaxID=5963 RepID=A0A1R2CH44_9CILI|nr:hypothetical protein SteCoe_9680 [Stentor coeruleus]